MQKECIAMLLAGGEGSRLGVLTKERAKPAVPFGGKYRIIDFTLSNCVNSGIDTVGVLTQYQPLELNDYIGNGQPWDLDRIEGGVHILPPYQKRNCADWYKGTANAIKQNSPFIEQYHPKYVLVLSGDHIYKMDYSKMLNYHIEKNADCTIAIIEVSLDEASRFGIMNTKDDNQIYEFEEKPKEPKSTKASMGVYIFNWEKLKTYLEADENDENSSNDFGKNVVPAMLAAGEVMYAYPFKGYWKDVGTIESLWEANMDLLMKGSNILSVDEDWKIYARSPVLPPHYIGKDSKISNCIISGGCFIEGQVESSVIFHGVKIEKGATVCNSILMPGAHILKGSNINYSIIDENVIIGENSIIGNFENNPKEPSKTISVIGKNINIGNDTIVEENNMLELVEVG
jgi:glucose-1-phosphate adenylyltransferase